MTKVQFGWAMPSGMREKADRPHHLDIINRGLEMGKGHFDSAWFVDHLQSDNTDLLEGWTAVSYIAATHPDFMFGHAVICQSFRNPALLAKMAATLQFMSGGRFILGVGAGWKEDEYLSYGYDFPSAGVRIDELDEYLQIIKALWHDERATFEGKHYRVSEAWCEPKPDPIPTIMIGAMKPKMIALTVRHADWWNVSWTKLEDFRRMVDDCERACEQQGRDPGTLRRTWFGGCACAPTEQALADLMADRPFPAGGIKGTPEQVIEQMRGFMDLGVDYFMLGTAGLPDFTTMEMLLDRVIPKINS